MRFQLARAKSFVKLFRFARQCEYSLRDAAKIAYDFRIRKAEFKRKK